tara:strand:+ start:415 stop:1161 length:747 start_codon:yes stop_codon:yes gene_type:complete
MDKSKYITNKKYDKLVSICIPSRNRPQQLATCIHSIINTVDNIDDIEIIVRFDNDDFASWAGIDLIPDVDSNGKPLSIKFIKGSRFGGYVDIWKMDNHMYSESSGEFQFHLNDDAIMSTKGWDTVLKQYSSHVCIIRCGYLMHDHHGNQLVDEQITENIFPIVHTSICDAMGCFGFNASNDKMYDLFCEWDSDLAVKEYGIHCTHFQEVGEHVKDNLPPTNPNDIFTPQNMTINKQLFESIKKGLIKC